MYYFIDKDIVAFRNAIGGVVEILTSEKGRKTIL